MQDNPDAIRFIDNLLQAKGLQNMDEEIRLQLRKDLLARLEDSVNRAILEALDPVQLTTFEQLVDTEQLDRIPTFLDSQGINRPGIVANAMAEFQAAYLET